MATRFEALINRNQFRVVIILLTILEVDGRFCFPVGLIHSVSAHIIWLSGE
jgi:hypothetical protein